ncbi:hypothetical protein WDW86_15960 [Bdellovibrionota bacterium FG-2]
MHAKFSLTPASFNRIRQTTLRLIVCPYCAKDYAVWVAGHRNTHPKQGKFDSGKLAGKFLTLSAFKTRVRRYQKQAALDELYKFGVFDKETGAHLGAVDFLG